ncbi:MAG: adenylate/guanylate cyclase domain-containing protein [Nitrosomonadales bacterium]|nr:adenylate/guanylate cyclase domain-containing protein [Nitrosomonadales bacterium]
MVVLFFAGNAAGFYQLHFIDRLSSILYDYRLQLTMPRTVDERIVILDIDEKSLKEEGRWPWGRDRLSLLLDKLFDKHGIAVLGFDVVFAEKDESSGLRVLQKIGQNQLKGDAQFQATLAQLQPQLEYDALFASKIRNRNVVLGYYLTDQGDSNTSGVLPEPVFPAGTFKGRPITFTRWNGYGANLPELQQAAASAGHFNPLVDADGEVRRVPMVVEYAGAYYESLSLAMVRTLLGHPGLLPVLEDTTGGYAGLEWLELDGVGGKLRIPVDSDVAAFVPYRGPQGSFRYISVADVLHDRVDVAQLKDKIVLLGTTAPGLLDMRATPVAEVYPGVEIHANVISGILDQDMKEHPAYMPVAEAAWLLLIGIGLSLLLPLLSPARAILVSLFLLAITQGMSLTLWHYGNLLFPVANSLLMISLLFALAMSYGYFVESRTKHQITHLFGKYVPAELVDEMSKHPEQVVSMEGESREMTILFSDVRGFTTISEGLDPKELSQLMNEFLTPLSRVISKYHGKVDKYMGDCIMAFWGAPNPLPDHARNAILAGLEMQSTLAALQPHFKERGWPEIHVGVGINSGRVSVGNMGSEVRVAYTVMGDEVNLASRLEGITKQYAVGIIVGENTRNAVTDFVYRELDHVRVKGKDKPVAIYEPIGLAGEVGKDLLDEIKLFHEVRRLYRKQDWDQVELQLMNLQRMSPDTGLYKIYAERAAYFRKHPPAADWDGVYVFETK